MTDKESILAILRRANVFYRNPPALEGGNYIELDGATLHFGGNDQLIDAEANHYAHPF